MVVWSTQATLAIIDFYRVNPFLWLNTHPDYYRARQRNEAILRFTRETPILAPQFAGLTDIDAISEVKRKFKSLQTYFAQERRKARLRNVSADESSKWEFYEPMSFLKALRYAPRTIQPVDDVDGPAADVQTTGIFEVEPFLSVKVETESPEPLTVWPDETSNQNSVKTDRDAGINERGGDVNGIAEIHTDSDDNGLESIIDMSSPTTTPSQAFTTTITPTPARPAISTLAPVSANGAVPSHSAHQVTSTGTSKRKPAPSDPGPVLARVRRVSSGHSERLSSFSSFVTQTLQLLPEVLANDAMLDVHRVLNTWLHKSATANGPPNGTVAWANQCLNGAPSSLDGASSD